MKLIPSNILKQMLIILSVITIILLIWLVWYKTINENNNLVCGGMMTKSCPVGFTCVGGKPEVDGTGYCKKIFPF